MPPRINYGQYRQRLEWYVLETKKYVCHIDKSCRDDGELLVVLTDADKRYDDITEVLEMRPDVKAAEKGVKTNYWIYGADIFISAGLAKPGEKCRHGEGSVGRAGINFAVYNQGWKDMERYMLHEEVHQIWIREFGEAPSVLNEGIAVYAESLLWDGREKMTENFHAAWRGAAEREPGFLRGLMKNAYFWNAYERLPVYQLGGELVRYLTENRGIALLKDIFLHSHYEDENLAGLTEEKTGVTAEELEAAITAVVR